MAPEERMPTSSQAQQEDQGLREQVRLIVGLLLGSGIAGTAIGFLGTEGLQAWGFGTVAVAVVAAVGLLVWSEGVLDRRRRERAGLDEKTRLQNVQILSSYYVSTLGTTGELAAAKLENWQRDQKQTKEDLKPSDVLDLLATDLRRQAESIPVHGASPELVEIFRQGASEIAREWEQIGQRGVPLVEGPPDGKIPKDVG